MKSYYDGAAVQVDGGIVYKRCKCNLPDADRFDEGDEFKCANCHGTYYISFEFPTQRKKWKVG